MRQIRTGSAVPRTVSVLALTAVLLTGCSTPVAGTASPGSGQPVDVPAGQLAITGAVDGSIDQQVRDALSDLTSF